MVKIKKINLKDNQVYFKLMVSEDGMYGRVQYTRDKLPESIQYVDEYGLSLSHFYNDIVLFFNDREKKNFQLHIDGFGGFAFSVDKVNHTILGLDKERDNLTSCCRWKYKETDNISHHILEFNKAEALQITASPKKIGFWAKLLKNICLV